MKKIRSFARGAKRVAMAPIGKYRSITCGSCVIQGICFVRVIRERNVPRLAPRSYRRLAHVTASREDVVRWPWRFDQMPHQAQAQAAVRSGHKDRSHRTRLDQNRR